MTEVGDRKCAKCHHGEHTKCLNPRECQCICNDIDWERPKTRRGGALDVDQEMIDVMKECPGRWAKVQHFDSANRASSIATTIRKGTAVVAAGKWDAAGRKDGNGGSDLFLVCLEP